MKKAKKAPAHKGIKEIAQVAARLEKMLKSEHIRFRKWAEAEVKAAMKHIAGLKKKHGIR